MFNSKEKALHSTALQHRSAAGAETFSRAAASLPAVSAGKTNAGGQVVQRAIGFEYETNAGTYLAAGPLTMAQRQNPALPPGTNPLAKGTVIVGGMGGLSAKADLSAGGGSNLELETNHFPETAGGRNSLNNALKKLERFCNLLNNQAGNQPHFRSSHLATAFGGNAPVSNRYIHVTNAVNGNPQASVGIALDKLEKLMERTAGGPTGGPLAVPVGAPMSRIELGVQAANVADFGIVGDAPRHVRQGIVNYVAAYAGPPALPGGFPSAQLVGLSALILTYIVKGSSVGPLAYAKQIAPLMARTDFGSMFTQDIPPGEQAFLSAGGGVAFLAMMTQALLSAGVAGGMGVQLFGVDPANAPGAGLSGNLTRQAWVAGISQGNDLLTTPTFPHAAAGPQLFGLGAMGPHHEHVDPAGANVLAPVFELRRIRQGVLPHEFTEMAMGIFDHIVALNSAGPGAAHVPYNQVARNVKNPTKLQNLGYNIAGGI